MEAQSTNNTILITGGAGFIGSALVRYLINNSDCQIVTFDKLTYAANPLSIKEATANPRHVFLKADICDTAALETAFTTYRPRWVAHLAAETHVDRSLDGPATFIATNIVGTSHLLDAARNYWISLEAEHKDLFRFLHVSTDEVYGSLGETGLFTEETPYAPTSPYSASKAASDHLVRAWQHSYGLPTLITNCSNNYGPCQFPEKLIPLTTLKALRRESLPVYGSGSNVRDWLYVEDHARALWTVIQSGQIGQTYNIGGNSEKRNIDVVKAICSHLDQIRPQLMPPGGFESLITFVTDRPGHDFRYAIDSSKIRKDLGWEPLDSFDSALSKTVEWYCNNPEWCAAALSGQYDLGRLGRS